MKKAVVLALAAIMVLGVAGAAFADSATFSGTTPVTNGAAPGGVQVTATVNPKISLTVTTPATDPSQTVAFGAIDPETPASKTVGLAVKSNKPWSLVVAPAGDVALLGFTHAYVTDVASAVVEGAKGTWSGTDTYSINVPYTTDPGSYLVTMQYTVTQP